MENNNFDYTFSNERFKELLEDSEIGLKRYGITHLAKLMKVSAASIRRYAYEGKQPQLENFNKIINYFGVSEKWLKGYACEKSYGTYMQVDAKTKSLRIFEESVRMDNFLTDIDIKIIMQLKGLSQQSKRKVSERIKELRKLDEAEKRQVNEDH